MSALRRKRLLKSKSSPSFERDIMFRLRRLDHRRSLPFFPVAGVLSKTRWPLVCEKAPKRMASGLLDITGGVFIRVGMRLTHKTCFPPAVPRSYRVALPKVHARQIPMFTRSRRAKPHHKKSNSFRRKHAIISRAIPAPQARCVRLQCKPKQSIDCAKARTTPKQSARS